MPPHAKPDPDGPDGTFTIAYTTVADYEKEAYHRIADLIEAKAAVSGFEGCISIRDIDVRQTA